MTPPIWSELDDQSRALLGRLYTAGVALLVVALVGAGGYHVLGAGRWPFSDCLYMSIITLSTVGFGELLPGMNDVPWARAWTVLLILLGSGTLVYFASTFTAMLVEGDLRGALRRRRMTRMLDKLADHVIVCGVGSTGIHVAEELHSSHTRFVVVDTSMERIERLAVSIGDPHLLYVVGDATDDHVLEQAGIRTARGLIAALTDDRDNLFTVVTARALSDSLRIVSKAVDPESVTKLTRAGADSVVAPALIGGVRMASEMVRPSVVQFLDAMSRDREQDRSIEEILVTADSPLAGRTMADARLKDSFDTLVIAIRFVDGSHEYNPGPATLLRPGMVLIVLVRKSEADKLRKHVGGRSKP
ncbi:MAG: potassium channel protein [Myxococcota bacterium]